MHVESPLPGTWARGESAHGSSFTPTPLSVLDQLLRVDWLRDGDTLYDIGCGDGRLLFEAARVRRIRAVGVDVVQACYDKCMSELAARRRDLLWSGQVLFLHKDATLMGVKSDAGSTSISTRTMSGTGSTSADNVLRSNISGESDVSGESSGGIDMDVSAMSGDDMIVGPRTVVFAHLTASAMRSVAPRLEECVQAGARVITYFRHPALTGASCTSTLGGMLVQHTLDCGKETAMSMPVGTSFFKVKACTPIRPAPCQLPSCSSSGEEKEKEELGVKAKGDLGLQPLHSLATGSLATDSLASHSMASGTLASHSLASGSLASKSQASRPLTSGSKLLGAGCASSASTPCGRVKADPVVEGVKGRAFAAVTSGGPKTGFTAPSAHRGEVGRRRHEDEAWTIHTGTALAMRRPRVVV